MNKDNEVTSKPRVWTADDVTEEDCESLYSHYLRNTSKQQTLDIKTKIAAFWNRLGEKRAIQEDGNDREPTHQNHSQLISPPQLARLIDLSRKVVEIGTAPECECEYQHEGCVAIRYYDAVKELESHIAKIETAL